MHESLTGGLIRVPAAKSGCLRCAPFYGRGAGGRFWASRNSYGDGAGRLLPLATTLHFSPFLCGFVAPQGSMTHSIASVELAVEA